MVSLTDAHDGVITNPDGVRLSNETRSACPQRPRRRAIYSRIMVVEDERIVAFDLKQRLMGLGYDVTAIASSGAEALRQFELTQPDCVLMDIRIDGDMDGIETATRLSKISSVPVVYLTAHSEESTIERARKTVPHGYLLKPFTEREMHATIQMAIERHRFDGALQ